MAILQLDTENADRDLTALVAVLTDTPDAGNHILCQGYVKLGDGAKDLDGTGGMFELVVTVGGQTIQPSPQIVGFGTEIRSALWTTIFPVPANEEVILRVKSPNVADNDVDVTAYLFDVQPPAIDANGKMDISLIEGVDATNQIRDAVVDDANRIDGSALNILSGHDPGATLAPANEYDVEMARITANVATEAKQDIIDTVVDAIKAKTDSLPSGIPKNVALSNFEFLMISSVDHISPGIGLAVTAQISQDGGAFAACTNAAAEVSNGVYKIDFIQAEMNADVITLRFIAAGADQRIVTIVTST